MGTERQHQHQQRPPGQKKRRGEVMGSYLPKDLQKAPSCSCLQPSPTQACTVQLRHALRDKENGTYQSLGTAPQKLLLSTRAAALLVLGSVNSEGKCSHDS